MLVFFYRTCLQIKQRGCLDNRQKEPRMFTMVANNAAVNSRWMRVCYHRCFCYANSGLVFIKLSKGFVFHTQNRSKWWIFQHVTSYMVSYLRLSPVRTSTMKKMNCETLESFTSLWITNDYAFNVDYKYKGTFEVKRTFVPASGFVIVAVLFLLRTHVT